MKRKYLLLPLLILTSCSRSASTTTTPITNSSINNTSTLVTSNTNNNSPTSITNSSNNSLTSKPTDSSNTGSIVTPSSNNNSSNNNSSNTSPVCTGNASGTNSNGTAKMPIPCNKDEKVNIEASSDENINAKEFSFKTSLPDGFRHIYGNNFANANFYAESNGGGVRFDQLRKGIQTPMFTTNKKLEIRLGIGSVNNNSNGNDIDTKKPVIDCLAFNENGNLITTYSIETITKQDENKNKRFYIDGTNVAYLEFRLIQFAYKGSQAYNIAITGLTIIAWIYAL